MKEKLIAFTRSTINLIWVIAIPTLLCLCFPNIFRGMGIIGSIIMDIGILLWVAVFLLFLEEDEEKIRNNNFFILLLSMNNFIWLPIFEVINLIFYLIIAILGIQLGILGAIITHILLVILSIFLGSKVAKHFSKKLK